MNLPNIQEHGSNLMKWNFRTIAHKLRTIMAVAAGLSALAVLTSTAIADGTETLGTPGIPIASGTDVIIAGAGLSLVQPELINVVIPAGASIKQVLLYWEGRDNRPIGDDTILLNGAIPVVGTLIGGPILWEPPVGGLNGGVYRKF